MTSQRFANSVTGAPRCGTARKEAVYASRFAEHNDLGPDASSRVINNAERSTTPSPARNSQRGFSLAELILNLAIILILAAMSVPAVTKTIQTYRIQADARRIYSLVTLARMRAAADFTRGEISSNLTAGTFQMMLYDKASSSYVSEGGTEKLSSGNSFSFGSIS